MDDKNLALDKIDKNMAVADEIDPSLPIEWYDVTKAPFDIYGGLLPDETCEVFHRIPVSVALSVSEMKQILNVHTTGIRARFKTDSPFIAIRTENNRQMLLDNCNTFATAAGFDMYTFEPESKKYSFVKSFIPPKSYNFGYESIYMPEEHDKKAHEYVLDFPLLERVKTLYIGIKKGSSLCGGAKYSNSKPVALYGPSTLHGAGASRPGMCYPAQLSRMFDLDYISIAFSGNALGEKEIAEYIGTLDISAFVLDYDHNAPDTEHLRNTHENFYKIVRKAKPDLPIIFMSRTVNYLSHKAEDELRREIIKNTYDSAVKRGENVYILNGNEYFDLPYADTDWSTDGIHPNDLGYYCMALKVGALLKKIIK